MNKKQLITFSLFAAMTTSLWADITINDGETVDMGAGAKTDYTENITINAGGTWEAKGAGNANVHFKGKNFLSYPLLTLNGNAEKYAKIDFQQESKGIHASIAILYNGKLTADYADIKVGDLGFTGNASIKNSIVDVAGIVAFGKEQPSIIVSSGTGCSQSMTNTRMTVKGHHLLLNEGGTYYSANGTLLNKLTMNNSSITVDDGVAETVAEKVTLQKLTMEKGSALTVETGTGVYVTGTVKVTDSSLDIGALTIDGGTLTFYGTSSLSATSITGTVSVSSGATLTLSSAALLGNITNNGGTVIFKNSGEKVEYVEEIKSSVTLQSGSSLSVGTLDKSADTNTANTVTLNEGTSLTVGTPETGTVTLTSSADNVVVSSVTTLTFEDIAETADANMLVENMVAAWDFEISNESGENIEVSTTIDAGLDVNTIKIWHGLEDGKTWELLNDKDGFEFSYDEVNGKLTFSTNSFSPIAVEGTVAPAPEPSAFGLLAGLGAIVLAVSRRRRTLKA